MHALTLHRPWAWAITHAGKNIENRDWMPPQWLVGQWFALHAGQTFDPEAWHTILKITGKQTPDGDGNPQGIVAVVRLAGYLYFEDGRGVAALPGNITAHDTDLRDGLPTTSSKWFFGKYGWMLDSVTAIDPVPCRGNRKLWVVPLDVEEQVRRNFARATGSELGRCP